MPTGKRSHRTSRIDQHGSTSRYAAVARKLGIALPAGLLMLTGIPAGASNGGGAAVPERAARGDAAACDDAALRDNEVARLLQSYADGRVRVAQVHANTHVNQYNPALKSHWDKHSNYTRY